MSVFEIVGGIIIMLCAIVIVVTVMMMEGKGGGLNALSGANESSYLGRNKSRTLQAQLSRVAKWTGILFVVMTMIVYIAAK